MLSLGETVLAAPIQAIRLITKQVSEHFHSSITNIIQPKPCTPVQENIQNVSPIKLFQGTKVPAPLTQQTNPVAPVPHLDPLASTLLQTTSLNTKLNSKVQTISILLRNISIYLYIKSAIVVCLFVCFFVCFFVQN